MMKPRIVIPTYKRAGKVRTLEHANAADVVLCVDEREADAYAACHPDVELLVHPSDVVGLAAKRQWIYEREPDVFMVDDDVAGWTDMGVAQPYTLSWEQVVARMLNMRRIAEGIGARLYGFRDAGMPTAFNPFDRLEFRRPIRGASFGMLPTNGKLYFHPEIIANEDLWISALSFYHHRLIVTDQYTATRLRETGRGTGGLADKRTEQSHLKDLALLQEHFGAAATVKKGAGAMPRKGKDGRTRMVNVNGNSAAVQPTIRLGY